MAPLRSDRSASRQEDDHVGLAQLRIELALPVAAGRDTHLRVEVEEDGREPLPLQPRLHLLGRDVVPRAMADEERSHGAFLSRARSPPRLALRYSLPAGPGGTPELARNLIHVQQDASSATPIHTGPPRDTPCVAGATQPQGTPEVFGCLARRRRRPRCRSRSWLWACSRRL